MALLIWLLIITVIVNGLLTGWSFDVALVKLPTRYRIGYGAYAQFARGNDLGNGLIVYPAIGAAATLLAIGTTEAEYIFNAPSALLLVLDISILLTLTHSACTAKAAPVTLSLKTSPDEESELKRRLNSFAFWRGFRTILPILTFISLVFALTLAPRQ